MTTLEDALYSGRLKGTQFSTTGPRRQLKINNAPTATVSYARPVFGASPLLNMDATPASMNLDSTAVHATPDRTTTNAAVPMAANAVIGSASSQAIDPSYRGIQIKSDAARLHTRTEGYMNRVDRVRERSEIDPYTGKKVDYYKQLPPEQNKDYRLPKETLKQVNRRLVAVQGYDHTQPKRVRREVYADAPQPDNTLTESAMYLRRMGELQERVSRDLHLNNGGERPTWVRDTQRAFGFQGYHDMTRHIPEVTPTMRADTLKPLPSAGQVTNPTPGNDLKVRGHYNDQAKHPHTEQVDYRLPPEAAVGAALQVLEQPRDHVASHRSTYEMEGTRPNLGGAAESLPPIIGAMSATRHKSQPALDFNFLSGVPLEGGHDSRTGLYDEHPDRKSEGLAGPARAGFGVTQPFDVYGGTVAQEMHASRQHRAGTAGAALTAPTAHPQLMSLPPMLPQVASQLPPHRASFPTQTNITYSVHQSQAQLPPRLDGHNDHQARPPVPTHQAQTFAQPAFDHAQPYNLPFQSDLQPRVILPTHQTQTYGNDSTLAINPTLTLSQHSDLLAEQRPLLPTHQAQRFGQTTTDLTQGTIVPQQSDLRTRPLMPTHLFQTQGASTQQVGDRPPLLTGLHEHALPLRMDQLGPMANALGTQFTTLTLPTRVSQTSDLQAPLRLDAQGAVQQGLGGAVTTITAPHYQTNQPSEHRLAQREQGKAHAPDFYTSAAQPALGGRTEPVFNPARRQSDFYSNTHNQHATTAIVSGNNTMPTVFTGQDQQRADQLLTNAQRGPAQAIGLGPLQHGENTKLQYSGTRAYTGNISATQYLHGGGEGSMHRSEGNINLSRLSIDSGQHNDRTRRSDLQGQAQLAGKPKRK